MNEREVHEREVHAKSGIQAASTHEFAVLNLMRTNLPSGAFVEWFNGSSSQRLDVSGLAPLNVTGKQTFTPIPLHPDFWRYSERGRTPPAGYRLDVEEDDRYTIVTISNYGIGVLVTQTSPDTWSW